MTYKIIHHEEIPSNLHPAVRRLFAEIYRHKVGFRCVEGSAGLGHGTLKKWFSGGTKPSVENLGAALSHFGLALEVLKNREHKILVAANIKLAEDIARLREELANGHVFFSSPAVSTRTPTRNE